MSIHTSEDSELEKRRRDLYAISIALIVFNVAGGSLEPAATTLFGSVHITRTIVLQFAAWIAWGYFVWQFWLAATPAKATFAEDIRTEIQISNRYWEYSKKIVQLFSKITVDPGFYSDKLQVTTQELNDFVSQRTHGTS
jgi:hypothetical protein